MARIRTIKPDYWEDEKVGKLPIPCRLLFIGCWNFADDFGIIKGSPTLLKSQIFPYDENLRVSEIKKWIDALVDARMLVPIIHAEESYYLIRTFRSHQVLDKRYDKSYIEKGELKELINNALEKYNVNTTSSRSNDDVKTAEEMEKEMESKKESPNGDKKEPLFQKTQFEKFNHWITENTPNVLKLQKQITEEEFKKIKEKYQYNQIIEILLNMENYKELKKKYTSVYLTFLKWAKKEYGY